MSNILRDLADIIARSLLSIFVRSWHSGKVPEDWKKVNVAFVFMMVKRGDLVNHRPISLTLSPGNTMKIILENISEHMKDKKVTKSSEQGSTNVPDQPEILL